MSSLLTRLKITFGSANADADALAAMRSDHKVSISDDGDLVLMPASNSAQTGVILYPGGRCDPRAYVELMRPMAETGYLIVIPHMPLRLAVLDIDRASKIMSRFPGVDTWIVGGHSMGGAMAAAWHARHPDAARGLFFIASYPAETHALPDSNLPVTMIYGTADTITRQSQFEASHARLPPQTDYVAIEGGDHYQFGSFAEVGVTATISRDAQHEQTRTALMRLLNSV
jgi:hypothetical protein